MFFLPLAAIIGTLLVFSNRPHFEKSFLAITETGSGPEGATFHISGGGSAPVGDTPTLQTVLFEFDPNTVTIQQLCSLGFDARVAAGIIKYRQRGKRFEIPEDFAACYGVTIEDYTRLEPYIIIDDRFRISPRSDDGYSQAGGGPVRGYGFASSAPTPSQRDIRVIGQCDLNLLDAAGFMALGFSPRQAWAIVR